VERHYYIISVHIKNISMHDKIDIMITNGGNKINKLMGAYVPNLIKEDPWLGVNV